MKKFGRASLIIFLIHPYIIPQGELLGNCICFISQDSFITALLFQFFVSIPVAIYASVVGYYIRKIIQANNITAFLFMGKFYK